MRKRIFPLTTILLFLCMLVRPTEVFHGAENGLLLWFRVVLPTLLPFIMITNLLLYTDGISYIAHLLGPVLGPLFRLSDAGCFVVVVGFLCGYPMGAKTTADLRTTGRISESESRYLLSFCNNTSPIFILNFIVWKMLQQPSFAIPAIFILFLAPMLCSVLFRRYYKIQYTTGQNSVSSMKSKTTVSTSSDGSVLHDFAMLDSSISNGLEAIVKVGGYIILFAVLIELLETLPMSLPVPLLATLEITTGIQLLAASSMPFIWKSTSVLALTAFGGWCSIAQTMSMVRHTDLKLFPYIIQKLITAMVTSLLCMLYIVLFT